MNLPYHYLHNTILLQAVNSLILTSFGYISYGWQDTALSTTWAKQCLDLKFKARLFYTAVVQTFFRVVQSWIRLWHSRNTTVFYPITQLHDYGHRYLSTSWSLFTAWKWRNRALGHPLWGLWKDWGGIYRKAKTSLWILLILHDQPGAEGTTVQSSTNFSKI